MTLAQVLPFKPLQPAVSDACRWSEEYETVMQRNVRLMFAWQRVMLRAFWGL